MTVGKVAMDVLLAVVLLALAGILGTLAAGMITSVRTVAGAMRRSHRRAEQVRELSVWCDISELADLDEALDEILRMDRVMARRWSH